MLGQRRRRRPNIDLRLAQYIVLMGTSSSRTTHNVRQHVVIIVDATSATLAQRKANISTMYCLCWDLLITFGVIGNRRLK